MTRNLWSTDPGNAKPRGLLSSPGGKAVVAFAAAVIAGGVVLLLWPAPKIDCDGLVAQSQAALDQADRDLKVATIGGVTARCAAYRTRVNALAAAAKVPPSCAVPPKRPGAWPSPDDERKWYESLIFEECR